MRTGIATFTLDHGQCPPWLFQRMVKLGREMTRVLISEYGPDEFIKRIADPVWFQSLGTVLAFDWNASGLTTILTAALKEAIREEEKDLGIFICGGKGKTSRKTPDEITAWSERINFGKKQAEDLVYSSKMAAKVDSSLIQDGYQLYHHAFFFTKNGSWTVVQQGMNQVKGTARRYHWHQDTDLAGQNAQDLRGRFSFVEEPHKAISAQLLHKNVLNMVSKNSNKTRDVSTELAQNSYQNVIRDIEILRRHSSSLSKMIALRRGKDQLTLLELTHTEFHYHPVVEEDFTKSRYLEKILRKITDQKPENYQAFLAIPGVGPKTVRALALVSEIIYGATPSYEDPARYSFAHGGKDATPYPVDRQTYDKTIAILAEAVRKTRLNPIEKDRVLFKLRRYKDRSRNLGTDQP